MQFLSELITGAIFVGILVWGGGLAGNSQEAGQRIVGYMVVLTSLSGLQGAQTYIKEHMEMGTLEQLYLSPFGLRGLIAVRYAASFIRNLVVVSLTGTCLLLALGLPLLVDWRLLPLLLMSYIAMSGLGLLVGALTLRFKRTGAVVNLVSLASLGVVAIPPDILPTGIAVALQSAVPFVTALQVLGQILNSEIVAASAWAHLALLAGIYLLLGSAALLLAEESARKDGQLAAL